MEGWRVGVAMLADLSRFQGESLGGDRRVDESWVAERSVDESSVGENLVDES